jgi:hypothetical protein
MVEGATEVGALLGFSPGILGLTIVRPAGPRVA